MVRHHVALAGLEIASLIFILALNPTMTVDLSKAIEVGDIALVTGIWTLQGQTADRDMKMSGAFANIVRRQADGTWLCLLDNAWRRRVNEDGAVSFSATPSVPGPRITRVAHRAIAGRTD
jgi:hypothetical protein